MDGTTITCFTVRECEGSSRMGSRPHRYLFTGLGNRRIQMWDLTTAIDLVNKTEDKAKRESGSAVHIMRICNCSLVIDHTILGLPWFQQHNLSINWITGEIVEYGMGKGSTASHCSFTDSPEGTLVQLLSSRLREGESTHAELPNVAPPDLSVVPECYHVFQEVFSESQASSLPPHREYSCAVDLPPGILPPSGRRYSLPSPGREAMEWCISISLRAGIICPTSSPTGAGFMEKKDGALRPSKDYCRYSDITIKSSYPLPLTPPHCNSLRGLESSRNLISGTPITWHEFQRERGGKQPSIHLTDITNIKSYFLD